MSDTTFFALIPGSMHKQAGGIMSKFIGMGLKKNFLGGLTAPVTKFVGGVRNAYGQGQKAWAAATNRSLPAAQLQALPLYQRGVSNASKGMHLRNKTEFFRGINPFAAHNNLGYSAGRLAGGLTVGSALWSAPFTASSYLGAYNADPEIAKQRALAGAANAANGRMQQFAEMPFMDRLRTAWDPSSFVTQAYDSSPQLQSFIEAIQNNKTDAPGFTQYLSSFLPIVGDYENTVGQAVRAKMLSQLPQAYGKSANVASKLFSQYVAPAAKLGWRHLWNPAKRALPAFSPGGSGVTTAVSKLHGRIPSAMEGLAARAAYSTVAHPFKTLARGAGAAVVPWLLADSYGQGKNTVYDQAEQAGGGLGDYQFMNQFMQPGFMGGLQRFGAAMMPGMAQNYVGNKTQQLLYGGQ